MSGLKSNRSTHSRSRLRVAGGMALGCAGVLVLISLVAMPLQYLFSVPDALIDTPKPAIAQAPAQRPSRTPRQAVTASPAPLQSVAQDIAPSATATAATATAEPTSTPTPAPTNTPAATPTPSPEPTPPPTVTPAPTATPPPTPTPTPLPVARVTPIDGTSAVNLRFGPGLGYAVIGVLRRGEFITVTGVVQDQGWWRVDLDGKPAWVSARVVKLDGDRQWVDIVPAKDIPRLPPPPATLQPTAAPGS